MTLPYVQGTPYFTARKEPNCQYPYLTHSKDTEVIIVGGGVTGCILGYYFTKANIPTILLEKKRIAHGSTSITTALLQYELDSLCSELLTYTTKDNVLQSYRLGLKALEQLDDFIHIHGNECNYKKRDCLLYTAKKQDAPMIENEYKIRKEAGFNVSLIHKEDNPFAFDIEAGVYSHDGGAEVDPYQYAQQLLKVATKDGLQVYENTAVTEIQYLEQGVEVVTEYGKTIHGKVVILATGYDTDVFTKRQFGTKTVTYNIVTNSLRELDQWYKQALIRDYNDPYNYYRTTVDQRIIAGGQDVPYEQNCSNKSIAEKAYDKLEQNIHRIYPNGKEIQIDYQYCGAFASTQDNLGFIGKDPEHNNLWYGLGYGANGILFALLGGDMLSRYYQGDVDENLKLFRVDRFDQ